MLPEEDGSRRRAEIVEALEAQDLIIANKPEMVRFRCSIDQGKQEEIMTHNDICKFAEMEADNGTDGIWKIIGIIGHKYVKQSDPDYQGSKWNIFVHWATGEKTWAHQHILVASDIVTLALYGEQQ